MNVEFGCRHVPRFEVAGKPELLRTLLDQKWHEQPIGLKITVENIPRACLSYVVNRISLSINQQRNLSTSTVMYRNLLRRCHEWSPCTGCSSVISLLQNAADDWWVVNRQRQQRVLGFCSCCWDERGGASCNKKVSYCKQIARQHSCEKLATTEAWSTFTMQYLIWLLFVRPCGVGWSRSCRGAIAFWGSVLLDRGSYLTLETRLSSTCVYRAEFCPLGQIVRT